MTKTPILLFLAACVLPLQAQEPKTKVSKNKKIQPLSEQFLLFLAEVEEVDGELIHPVDLTKEDKTNKTVKLVHKDGKKDDDK